MNSGEAKQKYETASQLFKSKRHKEALELLDELLDAFPDNEAILQAHTRVRAAVDNDGRTPVASENAVRDGAVPRASEADKQPTPRSDSGRLTTAKTTHKICTSLLSLVLVGASFPLLLWYARKTGGGALRGDERIFLAVAVGWIGASFLFLVQSVRFIALRLAGAQVVTVQREPKFLWLVDIPAIATLYILARILFGEAGFVVGILLAPLPVWAVRTCYSAVSRGRYSTGGSARRASASVANGDVESGEREGVARTSKSPAAVARTAVSILFLCIVLFILVVTLLTAFKGD